MNGANITATIARRDLYDHDTYEIVTLDLPATKGQIEDGYIRLVVLTMPNMWYSMQ